MDYNFIKKLSKQRKLSIKELSAQCGMTEVGFHQSLNNMTLKVETLEKIAEILKVSVSVFFDSGANLPVAVSNESAKIIGKFTGKISAEDLETPLPLIAELTQDIMDEDISNEEKIILLRERIALQAIEIMKLEKLAELRRQNIDKLKKQIAG
jgi:transcriptional regulator with XRE-family HTH domain